MYARRKPATSYIYMYPLMKAHPYALQMQEEMIRQVEEASPAVLVFVHVPSSWMPSKDSPSLIFQWLDGHVSERTRLVGLLELEGDDPVFRLGAAADSRYREMKAAGGLESGRYVLLFENFRGRPNRLNAIPSRAEHRSVS